MKIIEEAEKFLMHEARNYGGTNVITHWDEVKQEIYDLARHLDEKYELKEKPCLHCDIAKQNMVCTHSQPEVEKEVSIAPDATVTLHDHEFKHVCCQLEVGKKELCPKGCFQCDSPKGVITSWSFPCEKGGHCHHNSCDVRHEKPCDEPNCVQSKYRHRKDLSDLELREMKLQPQPSKVENKELQIAPDVTATIKGHEFTHSCCQPSKCEHEWVLQQRCSKCEWLQAEHSISKPSSELPELPEELNYEKQDGKEWPAFFQNIKQIADNQDAIIRYLRALNKKS